MLASWTGRIGLLLTVAGSVLMVIAGQIGLPSRSSLGTVEGTVTEATQVTRTATRRGQGARVTGVHFVITIVPARGGEAVKLSMPSDEISREQVVSVIRRQVKAEYDGERDVYALTSEGRTVISYDETWRKRSSAIQVWAERGKFLLGLGIPLALIGWPLGQRKLRKAAAQGVGTQSP
jgi:hypothetical protein